jgi:hypothetical protein
MGDSVPQPQPGELRRTTPASYKAIVINPPKDAHSLVIDSPKQTKLISLKKGFFSTNHKIFTVKPKYLDQDSRQLQTPNHHIARDYCGSQLADHDDSTAHEKGSTAKVEINFANILEEALRMNGVSNWQRTESARRRERERQKQQEEQDRIAPPVKLEADQDESYLSSHCSPRKTSIHVKPLRLITTSKKNTIGFFARKIDPSSSPVIKDSDSDSFDDKDAINHQASAQIKKPKPNSSFTALKGKGRLKTINFSQKAFMKDNPQDAPFRIHIASKSKSSLMPDNEQLEEASTPKPNPTSSKNFSLSLQKKGELKTFSKKLLTLSKKGTLIQQCPTLI